MHDAIELLNAHVGFFFFKIKVKRFEGRRLYIDVSAANFRDNFFIKIPTFLGISKQKLKAQILELQVRFLSHGQLITDYDYRRISLLAPSFACIFLFTVSLLLGGHFQIIFRLIPM